MLQNINQNALVHVDAWHLWECETGTSHQLQLVANRYHHRDAYWLMVMWTWTKKGGKHKYKKLGSYRFFFVLFFSFFQIYNILLGIYISAADTTDDVKEALWHKQKHPLKRFSPCLDEKALLEWLPFPILHRRMERFSEATVLKTLYPERHKAFCSSRGQPLVGSLFSLIWLHADAPRHYYLEDGTFQKDAISQKFTIFPEKS